MNYFLFPQISPIAFTVFSVNIYWYSFAYIIGLFGGFHIIKLYNNKAKFFTEQSLEDLLFFTILGVIIGARIGFCLFYDFEKTIFDPISILKIRNGGMSFHGGFIGLVLAVFYHSIKYRISFLRIGDFIALVAPMGIFLGRIGNFFNLEHLGKITTVPWAIIFPNTPEFPRHPSQLYKAFTEGLLLLIILNCIYIYSVKAKTHGFISACFLILYSLARFTCEIFREPDYMVGMLSIGQLLCIPMFIFGLIILKRIHSQRR